jgi:hypothetical protein
MKKTVLFVFLFVLSAQSSFAARCATEAPRGSRWKECTNARSNAVVDQFLLNDSGDLFAYISRSRLLCSVTNAVSDMKVSGHPRDNAVLYFVRQGDLYIAHNVRSNGRNCPDMSKKELLRNVKKYNVVSNTATTVVNTALSRGGEFLAWDNNRVVYHDRLVQDYLLNRNYASSSKAFNSYVAFTIDYAGFVTKVEGQASYNALPGSKETKKRYSSIQQFKREFNLD